MYGNSIHNYTQNKDFTMVLTLYPNERWQTNSTYGTPLREKIREGLVWLVSAFSKTTGLREQIAAALENSAIVYPAVADNTVAQNRSISAEAEHYLDTYGNAILRLAYSYLHNMADAEEVLQDTLVQFIHTAPVFENEPHAKSWLMQVAANLSKNRIRSNRIRQAEDLDELQETLAGQESEDLSFVWEAVKSLPEKYREVIHLFYQEGYATGEIARILQRKESTVRSDLKRGRERLKEILQEVYDYA